MGLRAPYTACEHQFDTSIPKRVRKICFRHPGYDDPNILFSLFGFDSAEGGLHYQIAHYACAIIAGNRFDGYLAISPTGPQIEATELLLNDNYFFIVPPPLTTTISLSSPPVLTANETPSHFSSEPAATLSLRQLPTCVSAPPISSYRYPVVPSFRHWHFPHGNLPAPWESLRSSDSQFARSGSNAVALRDNSCRMTKQVESCDEAHIVPKLEADWFNDEQMDRYGQGSKEWDAGIHDCSNQLLLRTDLHRSFDQRQFVFVPKLDIDGVSYLTTHVVRDSKEIRTLYHNMRLHEVDVAPEYLFARFAYTIFPMLKSFLERGPARLLLLNNQKAPKEVEGSDCALYVMPPNSRNNSPTKSGSPKKRARPGREGESDELEDNPTPPAKRMRQEAPGSQTNGEKQDMEEGTQASDCHHNVDRPSVAASPLARAISGSTVTGKEDNTLDFRRLKKQWLLEERTRSDSDNTWQREQDWLKELRDAGGGIGAEEIPRYLAACGYELIPDINDIEV